MMDDPWHSCEYLSSELNQLLDKSSMFRSLVQEVCGKYIDINFSVERKTSSDIDHVLEYAKESPTLGMIFLEVKDAIREGDGIRVLRCWKYFFLCSGVLAIQTIALRH